MWVETKYYPHYLSRRQYVPSIRSTNTQQKSQVTVEEVNRVLEVGRLLFSVLTEEEIAELQRILNGHSEEGELGNAGVT